MTKKASWSFLLFLALAARIDAADAGSPTTGDAAGSWKPAAAAAYLDGRANWWVNWTKSQRDHGTSCISCHTALPYVLSRSILKGELREGTSPQALDTMLNNVRKRVSLWKDVQPYYLDAKAGPGKSKESRSTESVLNALILASEDRRTGHLSSLTRDAFDDAWALQIPSGPDAGAWDWQVFHLAPWEAVESRYAGATWMALAVGWAPDHYQRNRKIAENLKPLRSYLERNYTGQTLMNKVGVLWASEFVRGLLTADQKRSLLAELRAKQKQDGGWNLASLGAWTRSDHTEQDEESDGLATALIALALKDSSHHDKQALEARQSGLAWLRSHQEAKEGSWRAFL